MRSILHIIPSLGQGGAELALCRLLLATSSWEHQVVVMTSLGSAEDPLASRLRSSGIQVHSLGCPRMLPSPQAGAKLIKLSRTIRPVIAMGWMYHGCLAATALTAIRNSRTDLVWTIRSGCSPHVRPSTRIVRTLLRTTSNRPAAIVYPSTRALQQHHAIGFNPLRSHLIPNGYDLHGDAPPPDSRPRIRQQLGISESAPVVAWIGRWHPDKAPEDALAAFAILHRRMPSVVMLMAGTGCGTGDPGPSSGLPGNLPHNAVRFLGRRCDAISLMAAADVLCLSSHSESFPNVLAEAMLAGTPCVGTDTGDARDIIGSTGVVVDIRSPHQLADGLYTLLNEVPAHILARRQHAHDRIASHFSMMRTACAFDMLWRTVLDRKQES